MLHFQCWPNSLSAETNQPGIGHLPAKLLVFHLIFYYMSRFSKQCCNFKLTVLNFTLHLNVQLLNFTICCLKRILSAHAYVSLSIV